MKISGFTFIRNASKLQFPFKESVLSILPLVDEFIIVFCEGDDEDNTAELLASFNSDKIKIVVGTWNPEKYKKNTLYAHLTDQAKSHCYFFSELYVRTLGRKTASWLTEHPDYSTDIFSVLLTTARRSFRATCLKTRRAGLSKSLSWRIWCNDRELFHGYAGIRRQGPKA